MRADDAGEQSEQPPVLEPPSQPGEQVVVRDAVEILADRAMAAARSRTGRMGIS
jgi:hypothetical protein